MTDKFMQVAESNPELAKIFKEGLSAASIRKHEKSELEHLIADAFGPHGELRLLFGVLYREWSELPNITLDQGCLLLLTHNPVKPIETADPSLNLAERFYGLKNRLEIEVGTALKPIKHYVPGMPRRFYLSDVARIAGALRLEPIAAAVISEVIERKPGTAQSTATPQQRRVDERMNFHRDVVEYLLKHSSPMAHPIPPKDRPSSRRKFAGAPVNVEVNGMTQEQYCDLYRKMFAERKNRPRYNEPASTLVDDTRALNIAFAEGRPKGAKDKKKRRRAGGR